jgi:magnesium transporter
MIGGVLCAIISRYYALVLGKILILAMFIPLVLTLSESSSMQSVIQSIHYLRGDKKGIRFALFRAFKEWMVVALIAATSGFFVGMISLLWQSGALPSFAIGLGIFISIIVSCTFGIWLPVFLHKIRLDPKVASGPIVLTLADVLTTAIYLSLATWWLI